MKRKIIDEVEVNPVVCSSGARFRRHHFVKASESGALAQGLVLAQREFSYLLGMCDIVALVLEGLEVSSREGSISGTNRPLEKPLQRKLQVVISCKTTYPARCPAVLSLSCCCSSPLRSRSGMLISSGSVPLATPANSETPSPMLHRTRPHIRRQCDSDG